MLTVQDIATTLEAYAPLQLAEDWDNVGLLVGDRKAAVRKVMTCLTMTATTVEEAVAGKAQMVVAHHPLPFHPLKTITTDTPEGRMLIQLITAGIAVYSPHTAFDSATAGINQHLATALKLDHIAPLVPAENSSDAELGAGRMGSFASPSTLGEVVVQLKAALPLDMVRVVGEDAHPVNKVGIACGAGGSFLEIAQRAGCDCFLTGEATYHTCLAAEAAGMALILTGHHASERFALDVLAEFLGEQFPEATFWASKNEREPLRVV